MVNIDILKKGDEVMAINERILAVKRKNGCVDIYTVLYNEQGEIFIDPVKAATVGYGEGIVSKESADGETTVYTF